MTLSLKAHYGMLLGLDSNWSVEEVRLEVEGKRVEVGLKHGGGRVVCPEAWHAAAGFSDSGVSEILDKLADIRAEFSVTGGHD